jgi:pyruvate-ferredoxin/flavodoxin oxidoreductase
VLLRQPSRDPSREQSERSLPPSAHARAVRENPFILDSPRPTLKLRDYADNELRYRMLRHTNPKAADRLMQMAQADVDRKWKPYEEMATLG